MFSPGRLLLEKFGSNLKKHLKNSSEGVHKWRPLASQSSAPGKDLSGMLG